MWCEKKWVEGESMFANRTWQYVVKQSYRQVIQCREHVQRQWKQVPHKKVVEVIKM